VTKTRGKGLLKVAIIYVYLVMLVIDQKELKDVKCKISALNNLDLVILPSLENIQENVTNNKLLSFHFSL
jgi:hypothetical protein